MWPYKLAADPIAQRLNAKTVAADTIRRQLRWRMQQVQYPYPPTTRKTTSETIYQVVRKHGLMDALLKPAFISQVPDGNVTYAGCARLTTLAVSSS